MSHYITQVTYNLRGSALIISLSSDHSLRPENVACTMLRCCRLWNSFSTTSKIQTTVTGYLESLLTQQSLSVAILIMFFTQNLIAFNYEYDKQQYQFQFQYCHWYQYQYKQLCKLYQYKQRSWQITYKLLFFIFRLDTA